MPVVASHCLTNARNVSVSPSGLSIYLRVVPANLGAEVGEGCGVTTTVCCATTVCCETTVCGTTTVACETTVWGTTTVCTTGGAGVAAGAAHAPTASARTRKLPDRIKRRIGFLLSEIVRWSCVRRPEARCRTE